MEDSWIRRGKSQDNGTVFTELQYIDPVTGSDYLISTNERVKTRNDSYYSGWSIPKFHTRVRNGELLPMTPFRQWTRTGQCEGSLNVTYTNGSRRYSSPWTGGTFQLYWQLTEADLEAYVPDNYGSYVQEAAAKIYGNGHDTLTFIAELADVRHLFRSIAEKMLKLKWPKGARGMSSEWLAMRYGWRTLLYDLEDLQKALDSLGESRTRYSERAGNTISTQFVNEYEGSVTWGTLSVICTDTVTIGLRGSVCADVEIPKFQFNPLITGWELIPFSFVIDWFVSVGKSLAALSFLFLNPKYVAAKGFSVKVTRVTQQTLGTPSSTYASGSSDAYGLCTAEIQNRYPCNVPLFPQFVLRLNTFKIFDLLALLVQRLR